MINKLVLENLRHRPIRTMLTMLAIGIEVMLILTLVGVSRGILDQYSQRARGIGADIIVRPPNSSVIGFAAANMPEGLLKYFSEKPGVKMVTGTVTIGIGGLNSVAGIDLDQFSRMSGGLRFLSGEPFQRPDDIMMDSDYAEQNQKKVGDTVEVLNQQWRVCGIVEPGKLSRLFLPIRRLQELSATSGKLSQIFLQLDNPNQAEAVVKSLKSELKEYGIYSIREFTSLYSVDNVPGLRAFINVIVALSVIVGFLVVGLTMYTAVLERTREIGIMKSMGATPGFIVGMLVRETLLLAIGGTLVGIVMAFLSRWLIDTFVPASINQMIVPDWWVYAGLIAMASALLGTLYPGYKAARQDAIEALSYE